VHRTVRNRQSIRGAATIETPTIPTLKISANDQTSDRTR
jgi:hypothetical protein